MRGGFDPPHPRLPSGASGACPYRGFRASAKPILGPAWCFCFGIVAQAWHRLPCPVGQSRSCCFCYTAYLWLAQHRHHSSGLGIDCPGAHISRQSRLYQCCCLFWAILHSILFSAVRGVLVSFRCHATCSQRRLPFQSSLSGHAAWFLPSYLIQTTSAQLGAESCRPAAGARK